MYLHANAKLGLAGRFALVRAIEDGLSLKAAAAAFSVSPATAHRWWHRWLEAGEEARASLSCLFDRSSRLREPRQAGRDQPACLAAALEAAGSRRLSCACSRSRDPRESLGTFGATGLFVGSPVL
ncbi:MAG: leucine zipper domain-containing protein [Gaiellaceae bacterium]|jgi:transposase-like protein